MRKFAFIVIFLRSYLNLGATDSSWSVSIDLSGGANKTLITTSSINSSIFTSYSIGVNAFYHIPNSDYFLKSGFYFGEKSEIHRDLQVTDHLNNQFIGHFIQRHQNIHYRLGVLEYLGDKKDFFVEGGPNIGYRSQTKFISYNKTDSKIHAKGETDIQVNPFGFGADFGFGISKPLSKQARINLGAMGYYYQMKFVFNNVAIHHFGINLKMEVVLRKAN